MKPRIMLILLMVLILGATLTTENAENTEILVIDLSKQPPQNPYQQEYERMLYPTVRIRAGNSTGSGIIFHRRDAEDAKDTIYILTASHVVGNNSEVTIELFYPDNIELEATVIITDTIKDLALLRALCASAVKYQAKLAPEDYKPYLFSPVWAVGCSLGLVPRPSQGIITYISDFSALSGSYWEVSSPILPGNSGGPVFDARTYEVIGIAVWVHTYKNQLVTTMAGVVPINEIYEFLEPQINTDEHRK